MKLIKRLKSKQVIAVLSLCVAIAVIYLITTLITTIVFRQNAGERIVEFERKSAILKSEVMGIDTQLIEYDTDEFGYTVFISVSDAKNKANVSNGNGKTIESAYNRAVKSATEQIKTNAMEPVWIKSDVVIRIKEVDYDYVQAKLEKTFFNEFMRVGISFDKKFERAVMETEINANVLLNYPENEININKMRNYLKSQGRKRPTKSYLEETLYLFTTQGHLMDEHDEIHELYNDGHEIGRRMNDYIDKEKALHTMNTSIDFLTRNVQKDGSFVYGYKPVANRKIGSYNILRHTGTIWSLVSHYTATGDESILPYIDSTVGHLLDCVVWKDENTAYILEKKNGELKLGGNGIAVFTLIKYMDVLETDEYLDLVVALGNGILELQNEDGSYWHVMEYPDFNRTDEFRTIYYDGEATFALAAIYGFTKEQIYLDHAVLALDYFIENEYEQYRDHWIAYTVNEVTKHAPEERFFEFGLLNVQANMHGLYNRPTTYHTFNELIMSTFELYDRIITNDIEVPYLEEFDTDEFLEMLDYRIWYMYNGYFYPEYVMYFEDIETHIGNFFVRHDKFRARIDDTQHFYGGLFLYYQNYERLLEYRELSKVVKPVNHKNYTVLAR
jgi:hypothetical protein